MSDIGPGDYVESLCASSAPLWSGAVKGAIYVVSDVGYWLGQPWVNCVGMKTPRDCGHPAPGWALRCFRPVYRPKSSLIESLKVSAPDLVEEPA